METNGLFMDKFLILGKDSRLARHFIDKFTEIAIPISHSECDITDEISVKKIIEKYNFKYVLNCAAMTDIDQCEKKPDIAFAINYQGPRNLKTICQKYSKKLILISSNYAVKPINTYGKSKQIMETLADDSCLVFRTDFYDNENFIVKNVLQNKKFMAYTNSFFNPVSVNRLVKEIYNNKDEKGLVNIFSSSCISYYDFAILFAKINKIKLSHIEKGLSSISIRPLNGCVKSDINIDIIKDLENYANH